MIPWVYGSADAAELWWVPDADTASTLRSALAQDWREQPAEVVVGGRPEDAFGWSWDGDTLAVRSAEATRVADADDAHVAVLFARTWNIRTEAPGWERWLPAGEAPPPVALTPGPPDLEPRRPVGPRRAPGQTPWSFGVGLGMRSIAGVPTWPSGRMTLELAVGSWWSALDGSVELTPFRLGGAGVVEGVQDLSTATLRSGIRSRGPWWWSAAPGIQFRYAAPALAVDGFVVSRFERPVLAGLVDFGVGRDWSVVRVGLHTWLRSSYTLPVSAGVDLDVVLFVHERRRWR